MDLVANPGPLDNPIDPRKLQMAPALVTCSAHYNHTTTAELVVFEYLPAGHFVPGYFAFIANNSATRAEGGGFYSRDVEISDVVSSGKAKGEQAGRDPGSCCSSRTKKVATSRY